MCKILRENTKSILQGDRQLSTTLCKLDIHYSERDRRPASHLSLWNRSHVRGHVRLVSRPLHLTIPLGSNKLQDGNNMIKNCFKSGLGKIEENDVGYLPGFIFRLVVFSLVIS